MKLLDKKAARRLTAAVVCAAMLAPVFVRGVSLDPWYDTERVKKTWEQPGNQDDKPTGLAFNSNAECLFPFTQAMYFTARPGYIKDDYKDFDNRFLYCVASHTQGYRMEPGMQMFFLNDYGINHPNGLFGPTKHGGGENVENFNFLMTAIACGYPDSYNPDNMADVPYYLICQTIAWVATNETSPGFQGVPEGADANSELEYFQRDLAFYKSQPEYAALEQSFPRNVAPEIYDRLHAAPPAGSAAAGMTNMVDAVFYDIWVAAYLTNRLTPDWDKEISATVTTAREENGKYYADVNLFVSDIAKRYLDGIDFQGFGDWTKESQDEDGTMHFSSSTGDTDENGCIGKLYWPNGYIGTLMPVDQTKAKLYTFEGYTDTVTNPEFKFGNTQIYFSSIIDQGLNLYIRIGEPDEGESEIGCVHHEHEETFLANYNLNLLKYDSETGKPLAGSHWDVLEKFDDSQLDNTDLDRTPDNPGSYESGLGTLNDTEWGDDEISSNYSGDMGVTVSDTNKYNWGNDGGTQFERWDDPHDDPCTRDDNVTKEDGLLYEIDSAGNASSDRAHSDVKLYTYHKGYCDGHPAPEIEYIECDHDEDEDCDCDEINQELHEEAWAAWYEEVEKCEQLVQEGGFFHCIEPGDAAKKAMEEDRDEFFKDFISLTYEYSAEEIQAAKGYMRTGICTRR